MIEFSQPWLFLLVLLPVAIYFLPPYRQQQASLQVPFFTRLVNLTGETPRRGASVVHRHWVQGTVAALGWLLVLAALARPEWVGPPITVEKTARDLMIALDLSGSMDKADFNASDGDGQRRLDAAKEVLRSFAAGRDGDRLGLIVFGNAAYLQAPFTDDRATWLTLLAETDVAMAGQSTALGDAIGLAISLFIESETQNRVLIVLTDGNDTGSHVPPRDAAEVAAAQGVTIYAVAVGDPETVGEEALDMDTLQAVAERSGGTAFEALDRAALEAAYTRIDELEPARFDSLSYRPRSALFYYPLAAFALLNAVALTLFGALGTRRRQSAVT